MGSNLIFIISQPRSGSTLLQKILCGHEKIVSSGESWILLPILYQKSNCFLKANERYLFDSQICNKAIDEFLNNYNDISSVRKAAIASLYKKIYSSYPEMDSTKYFLDKTPRYYFIINEIKEVFPDAKIIFLVRHPLSVLSSILNSWVKNDYFKMQFYNEDLFYAPQKMLSAFSSNTEDENMCLVKYEDYILSSNSELKRICDFLGLSFNEKLLSYDNSNKWKFGDPENVYKNKELNAESIDKWKKTDIFSKPQNWRILNYFINKIDVEYFNKFGYSFNEARDYLKSIKPSRFKLLFTLSPKLLFSKKVRRIGILQRQYRKFQIYKNKYGWLSTLKAIKNRKVDGKGQSLENYMNI